MFTNNRSWNSLEHLCSIYKKGILDKLYFHWTEFDSLTLHWIVKLRYESVAQDKSKSLY